MPWNRCTTWVGITVELLVEEKKLARVVACLKIFWGFPPYIPPSRGVFLESPSLNVRVMEQVHTQRTMHKSIKSTSCVGN